MTGFTFLIPLKGFDRQDRIAKLGIDVANVHALPLSLDESIVFNLRGKKQFLTARKNKAV